MILNILTVLFFVLGFALLFWMIVERRRDVLHYVTKTSRARPTMPADLRAQTSLAKQSRIVRYTEGKSEMSTVGLQELEELEHDAFRFAHSLNFENSWRIRRV